MIYQVVGEGKTYKVGFTRLRKNGKRRHFATIKAKDQIEAGVKFINLLYDADVQTEPGKYELCTGDWEVIKEETLY